MLYHLVYVSSAVELFSTEDLVALLAKSRANNERAGLSGMLLYKDGNFMQALEGEEAAVKETHARILRDPRHRGVITLIQGEQEGRQFPDWSMGFHQIRSAAPVAAPGFSDFLKTPLHGSRFPTDPTSCQKLLLGFKKSMA